MLQGLTSTIIFDGSWRSHCSILQGSPILERLHNHKDDVVRKLMIPKMNECKDITEPMVATIVVLSTTPFVAIPKHQSICSHTPGHPTRVSLLDDEGVSEKQGP